MHEGTSTKCVAALLTLARITFSLSCSMSTFFVNLFPLTFGSREYCIRFSVGIYLKYPTIQFHGNYPNISKYLKDKFCAWRWSCNFVFLKVLIVMGSWSIDLSIKPMCSLHTGQAVPLGMLSCHHDDTGQRSNLENCHDSFLAVTLFISLGSCLS